jgi:hypothetical protein
MTKLLRILACCVALSVNVWAMQAQQTAPEPSSTASQTSPPTARPVIPLRVQVVISRYQGDKRLSSVPYTMSVNADGKNSSLRMGLQVPVPSLTSDLKTGSVTYRDVGTNIDCFAASLGEGRFKLDLSFDDSSLYVDDQSQVAVKGVPVFRAFRFMNQTAVLKDGQTTQYTTATDKVSGETVKIDVTLNVVK